MEASQSPKSTVSRKRLIQPPTLKFRANAEPGPGAHRSILLLFADNRRLHDPAESDQYHAAGVIHGHYGCRSSDGPVDRWH